MKTKNQFKSARPLQAAILAQSIAVACLVFGCLTAESATIKKARVVITNVPPSTALFNVDGVIRTWLTTPTNTALNIQATNSIEQSVTNLYTQTSLHGFTNVNSVSYGTNTNELVFEALLSAPLTITINSNYATVTYSTSTVATAAGVRVPYPVETPTIRTQVVNGVAEILGGSEATNAVPPTAPMLGNFVNTTTSQQVSNKNLTGGSASNLTARQVFVRAPPSGFADTNYGIWFFQNETTNRPFAWLGVHSGRLSLFSAGLTGVVDTSLSPENADLLNYYSAARLFPLFSGGDPVTNGWTTVNNFTNDRNRWVGGTHTNSRWHGGVIGQSGVAADSTVVLTGSILASNLTLHAEDDAQDFLFTSPTIGLGPESVMVMAYLNPNQFTYVLDDFYGVSLIKGVPTTNQILWGNWTNAGNEVIQGTNVSGLAAGANIITVQNRNRQRLAATGGAASIIGITNTARPHVDGDWIQLENGTGYSLTLVNESGSEPITVDRLRTVNQVSNVVVQPGGKAHLQWDAVVSRWAVLSPEEISATQVTNVVGSFVNGVVSVATNSVTTNVVPALPPIGAVIAWLKTLTNTLTLSSNWVECNGQILTNVDSPLHLATIPDLNAGHRFLRGAATSGGTGGSATHTHTGTTDTSGTASQVSTASGDPFVGDHTHTFTTDASSSLPPYYDVVWVMRIK